MFMQEVGYIRIHELVDGETVDIGGTVVRPIRLAEDYVYGFLLDDHESRVLVVPDELKDWRPPSGLSNLDLAVVPIGIFEFDPVTGRRLISEMDPVLMTEATFTDTLAVARELGAREVAFSHIEALDEIDHDKLVLIAENLRRNGLPATIAYDGLCIDTRP